MRRTTALSSNPNEGSHTVSGPLLNRRRFLKTLSASAAMLSAAGVAAAGDARAPEVRDPRATDGDDRHEPDWDQRLTITVGPKHADLVGNSDKVLQAAVDYVARLGGGTVSLLPGTYTLRNAVFLPSGIRLAGSGADSVLTKIPSRTVGLAADSDWYDQEITLEEAGGFEVGDGVVLRATNPHHGGQQVLKRTLVARSGRRFKLDRGLRENLWLSGQPTAAALFPLLTSERTADVLIENLTLDGDRERNENLNGNYGGCLFLQDCRRYTIRNVIARNYNGDGISFQVCHDVVVENCHSHDNTDLGVHPGSGSQRPVLRGNRLERNRIGLFWCWGVKFGLAEDNRIEGNRDYGISIGHNDTDNVMRRNEVLDSGKVGVLFRDENRGRDFWPNRNTLEQNRIVNSGGEDGVAIDIRGRTRDLRIVGNVLTETRGPASRIGIRIATTAGPMRLADNRIEGFAAEVDDGRMPA
ncbi:MAG TPA: right-handed parallel beta-helix repeat-containing protein [Planctomycetaceae bacterium]|nr:right-handed parallel beta-helix repeat-containing protein [Planctomycetaceae bacterium]